MYLILADEAFTFSALFTAFEGAFNSVTSFMASHNIFMALIGLSIGAFAIGTVMKTVR